MIGGAGLARRQEEGVGRPAPGHQEVVPLIGLVRLRGFEDGGLGLEPGVGQ